MNYEIFESNSEREEREAAQADRDPTDVRCGCRAPLCGECMRARYGG